MQDMPDLEEALQNAVDPMGSMQRVVDQACDLIPAAAGALIGLVDGSDVTFVCGSGFLRAVRDSIPLDASLSGRAIQSGQILRSDEATRDPRAHHAMATTRGVGSAVCVPLRWRDRAIGVLEVDSTGEGAFDDHDVRTLSRLADFVSTVIGCAGDLAGIARDLLSPPRPEGAEEGASEAEARFLANILRPAGAPDADARREVEETLAEGLFTHEFQPIFDLWSGALFSLEALARFSLEPHRPPDRWFDQAHAVGLGLDLETASVSLALSSLPHLPPGVCLSLNAGPQAMASPQLVAALSSTMADRVVIELTEQVAVDDYPRLSRQIDRLRALGARLAIDDTGAGFASLAHILKLDPDLIKLDRALTSGIDTDPVRRALAAALVSFAAQTRAEIIAEGIETAEELEVLCELGVRYGQGYFLGRPGPLDAVAAQPANRIPSARAPLAETAGELLALYRRF